MKKFVYCAVIGVIVVAMCFALSHVTVKTTRVLDEHFRGDDMYCFSLIERETELLSGRVVSSNIYYSLGTYDVSFKEFMSGEGRKMVESTELHFR